MHPRPSRQRVVAVLTVCFSVSGMGALAVAEDPVTAPQATMTAPRGDASAATPSTRITGVAWNDANQPLSGAKVRLRNVVTGRIVRRGVTDATGRFAFAGVEPATYLVELVSDAGLTVSHTFPVSPGETVATFVRLGTKGPWFEGFFRNAASAVVATAASAGVTAIAPEAKPCSSPSPGCN